MNAIPGLGAATPGPWHVTDNNHPRARWFIYGANGDFVADANSCIAPDSRDANARIIAAAPELLDALRVILGAMDTMTTEAFSRGGDKDARDKARAAIALALGLVTA